MTKEEAEKFLEKNPILVIVTGLVLFKLLSTSSLRPEWLKDCPPVNPKVAGAWRGKGSFGRSFGPNKVRHK